MRQTNEKFIQSLMFSNSKRFESFSESHYILVGAIWEEKKMCIFSLYMETKSLLRLNIFDSEDFQGSLQSLNILLAQKTFKKSYTL